MPAVAAQAFNPVSSEPACTSNAALTTSEILDPQIQKRALRNEIVLHFLWCSAGEGYFPSFFLSQVAFGYSFLAKDILVLFVLKLVCHFLLNLPFTYLLQKPG
jgi:hypothetical protein